MCAVALAAAPASAATKPKAKTSLLKKAMWGPLTIDGKSAFPTYKRLGVKVYMVQLQWSSVAPTRPSDPTNPSDSAYRWPADLVTAVTEAPKYGMQVFVRVTGSPKWANGGRAPAYIPGDPEDLARFMAAASRRFPVVRYWDVWEETTRVGSFLPLVKETKRGAPLTAEQAAAPRAYAQMLDTSYAALKGVDRTDIVVGGNSFTTGDISPKNFIANLRLPDGRPPRMDMYAHNPFSGRKPDLKKPPLAGGFADLSDTDTLARWIDTNLARSKTQKIPIFITEFALPTDHANYLFNFFVSRSTQANWTTAALRLARGFSRVQGFAWFKYQDDAPTPRGDQPHFGLVDFSGKAKPSFAAFARG